MDSPGGTLTITILENYGYSVDPNVNLNVVDGSTGSLSITAAYYQPDAQTYAIDLTGSITP